ncbi:hypothetical protein [Robbsia andropogonis]|uniref:hypothetical protein n=1 Tax=Robbsia andropogonis TaxID=28092 RepID=UPI002A6AFF0E|nr:hypothetical protein [Robbsia andropogonis]
MTEETVDDHLYDRLLRSDPLIDRLNRAQAGDTHAARDALIDIAMLISPRNPAPIPDYVREYLFAALHQIATDGVDARKALHLKRPGRPNRSKLDKRIGADIVKQAHDAGASIEDAAASGADMLNRFAIRNELCGRWQRFNGTITEPEQLVGWFYQMKDELDAIRKAAGAPCHL